jgi:hypothetical protein
MLFLRQSTASQEVLLGPFVDDTDGKTAETGLTIANTDIKLWVEGATAEASKTSGGATHIASGRYYAVLDATDTATVGKLEINVHVSGALPVRREFHVLEEAVYDSLFAASAAGYQVPIWAAAGSTVNLSGTTVKAVTDKVAATIAAGDIATDAVDAASVKADAVTKIQNGLATPTNITAGTITTVTNLTNAPTSGDLTATMKTSVNTEVAAALATYDGPTNAEMVARTIAAADYATAAGVSAVETDTQDIQARLPAALTIDGNIKADALRLGGTLQTGRDVGASVLLSNGTGTGQVKLASGYVAMTWADIAAPTTTVNLSGTTIKTATDVETDTADIQSRIPAALSAGRMKADVELINGNGSAPAGLSDFATSGYDIALHQVLLVATTTTAGALGATAKTDVNTEVAAALTTYDAVTQNDLDARTLLAAEYATETLLSHVSDVADAIKLKTDNLPSDPADQSAVEAAIDSAEAAILAKLQGLVLEAATIGGTGNSTTAIHLPGLTYGDDEINSYLLVIRDVSEDEYHARWITDWVSSTAVATVATLPFTPQDSTDTYWLLSARADVTGGSGASVTDIRIEMDTNSTKLAAIDAKTTNLPADPADASDIAASFSSLSSTLTTIAGYIDTEVAAILAAVDTEVGAIKAKTDNLPASPAATGDTMTLADSAITAAKIGTGAITAAKFAAGAIDAAALNADAVAEIQSGLSTVTTAQVLTQVNAALDTAISELGIGTPATTPSIRTALMLLYMEASNESQDTTTQRKIKNAAGTVIAQGTVTSATGSVVLGKLASP